MDSNFSLSDIAAVLGGGGDGKGWGNGFILIILFAIIFMFGGGFGFGGRSNGNPVTEAGLCSANSFNELKGSVGRLSDQVDGVNINLTKGICDLGYSTQSNFRDLMAQIADCCCTTQRNIDSVRFDMANYNAATNANITAGIQKVLDKMCADREAAMAARIQQLELAQAMCGVVRYPTSTAYATNCNPFFGGCSNGNI